MAAHTTPDTDFNPLPRKEGDKNAQQFKLLLGISIHSLVKRETPIDGKQYVPLQFQSTPS